MNKVISQLKGCLQYCREQNGLDYCKNCGLDELMVAQVESALKRAYRAGAEDMREAAIDEIEVVSMRKRADEFLKKIQ